jgi:HEAT repeat protein
LGELAARDRRFVPQVVETLRSTLRGKDFVKEKYDFGLRATAASSLGKLKAEAKSAVPELIEALRAEGAPDAGTAHTVRVKVMSALGKIGPEAVAAVPHLLSIMRSKDSSEDERKEAAEALKQIDPEAKLPERQNR